MGIRVQTVQAGFGAAHLVAFDGGVVIVDAGSPGHAATILRAAESLGGAPTLIYITHAHYDHYGSAAALRRATGAPIAVHRDDAERMARGASPLGEVRKLGYVGRAMLPLARRVWPLDPVEPDIGFDDGARLDDYRVAGNAVHVPGHTIGSSMLLLDDGTAFVGDLLSHRLGIHAQHFYAEDWEALRRSLERLREIRPRRLYLGHGRRSPSGDILDRIRFPQA